MPTKNPRCLVTVDEALLELIEDFRYTNRYSSQSKAMVDLLKAGLNVLTGENYQLSRPKEELKISKKTAKFLESNPQIVKLVEDLSNASPEKRREVLETMRSYLNVILASKE